MNERDNELFEAELRRLKPARLGDDLLARLESPPVPHQPREARQRFWADGRGWSQWLRWLAPATVSGLVLLFVIIGTDRSSHTKPPVAPTPARPLTADQVEIDRRLLDSFDTVAELADGEPVQFRCQQWLDAVTLRDSTRGVEIIQEVPRIQVVPVSFAVY
jgi:hypothetical protein